MPVAGYWEKRRTGANCNAVESVVSEGSPVPLNQSLTPSQLQFSYL